MWCGSLLSLCAVGVLFFVGRWRETRTTRRTTYAGYRYSFWGGVEGRVFFFL